VIGQAAAGKRRLLLVMQDGTQKKIEIPDDWKVTFGALIPGQKESAGKIGLRLWSGKKGQEMQHAVFTDVSSFRDMSFDILEQVEERQTETFVKQGDESGEAIHADVRVKKWVNPDEVKSERQTQREVRPGSLIAVVRG
jgi:hypothetical protein